MPEEKKHLQKWKRREKERQAAISASIFPHYHCLICDQMIEQGDSYKRILKKTDRTMTYQDFCSKKCYEEFIGVPGKKKKFPWKWIFYIASPIAVVVVIVLIVIFVL